MQKHWYIKKLHLKTQYQKCVRMQKKPLKIKKSVLEVPVWARKLKCFRKEINHYFLRQLGKFLLHF